MFYFKIFFKAIFRHKTRGHRRVSTPLKRLIICLHPANFATSSHFIISDALFYNKNMDEMEHSDYWEALKEVKSWRIFYCLI